MKHSRLSLLVVLPLAIALFSCTEALPVSESGEELMADQHYYPLLDGNTWEYRVDTASASGVMVKDIARRYSSISGTHEESGRSYSIQMNRIVTSVETTFDTTYVRRNDIGVYQTTPGLLLLSGVGGIPGLPDFNMPDEILAIPLAAGAPGSTWEIIDFEYLDIPMFPIYFRVKGHDLGIESVQTDMGMFYECRRIRFSIDIRLPNMEDPTDIFNPMLIKEEADFWYTHPQGLVVADGSSAVFGLLEGTLPLSSGFTHMRFEVVNMDIVQPVFP